MRTAMNPYNNEAALVDKFIGTAYDHVKTVSDAIEQVKHLSENMQSVYDFATTKDALEAFLENPDFLPWLEANQETLEDLSALLASLVVDYAALAGAEFTGFVKMGEAGVGIKQVYLTGNSPVIGATNIWLHNSNPSKIIGISGSIVTSAGNIEALTPDGVNAKIWCDPTHLRMQIGEEATAYGNRPFHVILSIIE